MSFDGQNIVQKNLHSILQCEDALEKVELFDCAGYRDIGTALFAFVRAKKGNGNQRFFGEMFEKLLKFYIEKLLHIFVECDLFFCQARCFQNGGIIAGESSKGRKLGCAVMHGHLRMCFGNVVREMDDIAVV